MQSYLLVALGGAIGSVARYGTGVAVGRLWPTAFPLGTMIINVVGSFAMGLLVAILARLLPPWQAEARLFVAVGILGGFTTFSSFSLDAMTLIERGDTAQAVVYIIGSVVFSITALFLALLIVRVVPA